MKRFLLFVFLAGCWSCTKYLAKVSDQSILVPTTPEDFQSYLDNNLMVLTSTPGLGPLGGDDYWLRDSTWDSLAAKDTTAHNAYNWQAGIFGDPVSLSWNNPYTAIYYANVVLDGISRAADSVDPGGYDSIRGAALFYRGFHHWHLEETFGQPYRPASASTDPGIPLRLSDDLSAPDVRATVQQVYTQIVKDLLVAAPLLSPQVPWQYRNRPSRPAAYALLTEVFLTMQDYADAKRYADSSLSYYSGLVMYDTISGNPRPFSTEGNGEVLFSCSAYNYPDLYNNDAEVDTMLYATYSPNDLRRTIFFRPAPGEAGGVVFRGSYTGRAFLFSGLAVDLVYLSRAECRVRLGDVAGGLADLNKLLATRYQSGFMPYTAATAGEALRIILLERRKETLFREVRWTDLRRLNQDPSTAVYLYRVLGGQPDTLAPMDKRYTYPIPSSEIQLGGIQQNNR